jgi:hypothetical protein
MELITILVKAQHAALKETVLLATLRLERRVLQLLALNKSLCTAFATIVPLFLTADGTGSTITHSQCMTIIINQNEGHLV